MRSLTGILKTMRIPSGTPKIRARMALLPEETLKPCHKTGPQIFQTWIVVKRFWLILKDIEWFLCFFWNFIFTRQQRHRNWVLTFLYNYWTSAGPLKWELIRRCYLRKRSETVPKRGPKPLRCGYSVVVKYFLLILKDFVAFVKFHQVTAPPKFEKRTRGATEFLNGF